MKTLKITLVALTLGMMTVVNAQSGVLKQQARPQPKTISEADYKAHADGWMPILKQILLLGLDLIPEILEIVFTNV